MPRNELIAWVILPLWVLCLMGGAVIVVQGMIAALWFLLGPQ